MDQSAPTHKASSDRDLQPGHKVGEYVIEGKLGEGGFGSVFRASHPVIGKLAAVKVLHRQFSADPEMVSRFVAEARAVNQIRHRNIIDIFAFGELEDQRSYYTMELLDGQPLDEALAKGAMPLGEAIPILRSVARALDAAHAKGIAHRDLKPENIFLVHESDGSVYPKLLDFGIAKLLGTSGDTAMHKTRTGAPIGTPYYMSPEQCRGRDVDHRTDIYAFGIVAYKMLTGVVPFEGEDYMDILLKQIGEEPVPPSERLPRSPDGAPGLPKAVDDAIAWMMKKNPAERPPNLITAMRALEESAAAAGVAFASDSPTGMHASQTSRVAVQRTPSAITPLPSMARASAIGNAATVDSSKLSDAMDAARASGQGAVAAGVTMPPAKRSPLVLILALLGAIVVGVVVFVVVRSNKGGDATAKDDPVDQPVVDPGSGTGTATGTGAGSVEPKLVDIEITGTPPGTEVYGPRGLLGVAPGKIQLAWGDQDVILTFKAEGYVAASRTVKAMSAQTLEVTLDPKVVDVGSGSDKGTDKGQGSGSSKGSSKGSGKGSSKGSGKGSSKGSGKGTGSGSGTSKGTGRDTLEDPFAPK